MTTFTAYLEKYDKDNMIIPIPREIAEKEGFSTNKIVKLIIHKNKIIIIK